MGSASNAGKALPAYVSQPTAGRPSGRRRPALPRRRSEAKRTPSVSGVGRKPVAPFRIHKASRWAGVLVLALALAGAAVAQTIYIWEDEDGVTHFTDRKPDTDREVTVQRAIAEPRAPFDVTNLGSNAEPRWVFRNRLHGVLEVEVSLADAENVVSEPDLPARFVLPPNSQQQLVTVGPLNENRSWRYRIQSRATPGDPDAEPDPDYPYRPPFAADRAFRVSQAFGGSFSHNQPHSHHAVDIDMPLGTPVHAARSGVVMDAARYFHATGDDPDRYGNRANFIRIEHADGTMAVYAHLDYEGVEVQPGQWIAKGQRIGRSGQTGFATGPHLHFVIQKNAGMEIESVPFAFGTGDGSIQAPRENQMLRNPE